MRTYCKVTACHAPGGTKNLCPKHYQELRRKGSLKISESEVWTRDVPPCSVEDCKEAAITQGMCGTHYARWLRHGDPRFASDPNKPEKTAEEVFWKKVQRTDGCWLWTGHIDEYGKGRFAFDGKYSQAHRFAFMQHHGVKLQRYELVRQTCKVAQCVNPKHLKLASSKSRTS